MSLLTGVRRGVYHVAMKKTPKLVLDRETLRALAGIELTRAAGGGDAALPRETGKVQCTFVLQGVDEPAH